jgi:hypothetical protein
LINGSRHSGGISWPKLAPADRVIVPMPPVRAFVNNLRSVLIGVSAIRLSPAYTNLQKD